LLCKKANFKAVSKLAPKSTDWPKSSPKIHNPWKAIPPAEWHQYQPNWAENLHNLRHCCSVRCDSICWMSWLC